MPVSFWPVVHSDSALALAQVGDTRDLQEIDDVDWIPLTEPGALRHGALDGIVVDLRADLDRRLATVYY
jgi:hypothetical protein